MNEHNQKHLTLSNRTYIEQELLQKIHSLPLERISTRILLPYPKRLNKKIYSTVKLILAKRKTPATETTEV